MIDGEHDGFSKHITWLDIDKPGLWPWKRPAPAKSRAHPWPRRRLGAKLRPAPLARVYGGLSGRTCL
ncbi:MULTISPECIES: hypothetical protein [unclassified Streptomyces]|uniref:hypothetical protein n=1 Tax=Streptomyces sp. NPDC127129 TaxID=3345373 RepID=UPI00362A7571